MSKVFAAHAVSREPSILAAAAHTPRPGCSSSATEGKDVTLMGGGVVTEALKAGLVDELIRHQVPVLLGAGRPFFQELPEHVHLRLLEAVSAPGVTHEVAQ